MDNMFKFQPKSNMQKRCTSHLSERYVTDTVVIISDYLVIIFMQSFLF